MQQPVLSLRLCLSKMCSSSPSSCTRTTGGVIPVLNYKVARDGGVLGKLHHRTEDTRGSLPVLHSSNFTNSKAQILGIITILRPTEYNALSRQLFQKLQGVCSPFFEEYEEPLHMNHSAVLMLGSALLSETRADFRVRYASVLRASVILLTKLGNLGLQHLNSSKGSH